MVANRQTYFESYPVPYKCSDCRHSAELRAQWGCEKDATQELFEIPCVACWGENPECGECSGSGREKVYRCPLATITEGVGDALSLHGCWPEVLPVSGGLLDQPADYFAAMKILDRAKALQKEAEEASRKPNG